MNALLNSTNTTGIKLFTKCILSHVESNIWIQHVKIIKFQERRENRRHLLNNFFLIKFQLLKDRC